jgi:hypothetical protein
MNFCSHLALHAADLMGKSTVELAYIFAQALNDGPNAEFLARSLKQQAGITPSQSALLNSLMIRCGLTHCSSSVARHPQLRPSIVRALYISC